MCVDHPEVHALVSRIDDRRIVTYGESPQADVRYSNHRMDGATSVFDVSIRHRMTGETTEINDLRLPMPGKYNVANATAAIAVAHELGLDAAGDCQRTGGFQRGSKRRFTPCGKLGRCAGL